MGIVPVGLPSAHEPEHQTQKINNTVRDQLTALLAESGLNSTNTALPDPTEVTTVETPGRSAVFVGSQPHAIIYNTEHGPKMITQS